MAFHVPAVWGTGTWVVVHTTALVFSEEYRGNELDRFEEAMIHWYSALPYVLPCRACGAHCYEYIKSHPPPIKGTVGTRALFNWTVDFHNSVNQRTGKRVITHEEAYQSLMTRINEMPKAVELHQQSLARIEDKKAFGECRQKFKRSLLITRILVVLLAVVTLVVLCYK